MQFSSIKNLIQFILMLSILTTAFQAEAHVLKNSSSELNIINGRAVWSVAVHKGDFDLKFRDVSEETIKKFLAQNLKIKVGQKFCVLENVKFSKSSPLQRVYFSLNYDCGNATGDLEVLYSLFYGDWNHRHLARIIWDGNVSSFTFSPGHTQLILSTPSEWNALWAFFRLGFEHILMGYDHILFLFTLLLGARKFSHLLWLVTAFTLAHSLSLALATLGYVQLGPQIVEPAIAASIVILALLDFLTPEQRETRGMIPITFAFGLIHGLGFSAVLRDSGISGKEAIVPLLSFNVGVEAGQILIVSAVYGFMVLLKKKLPHGYPVGRKIALALIGGMAMYWFVTRLGGI